SFDATRGVQRAFQVEVIKLQVKCLEVKILFAAQISDSELSNIIQLINICTRCDGFPVFRLNRGARKEIASNIHDVVALVTVGREFGRIWFNTASTSLDADSKVFDLVAGVVIVELAQYIVALRRKQAA